MDALEYLRNFIQLKRNLVSTMLGELRDEKGTEHKRSEILGQVLAYNMVLKEIENYREMMGK